MWIADFDKKMDDSLESYTQKFLLNIFLYKFIFLECILDM